MVKFELTQFRLGMITGVLVMFGVSNIFTGLEVVIFDGLLVEWTFQRAILSISFGLVLILVASKFAEWSSAVQSVTAFESKNHHKK